jgi:hypothetical protein
LTEQSSAGPPAEQGDNATAEAIDAPPLTEQSSAGPPAEQGDKGEEE